MPTLDPAVLAHLEWIGFVRPTGLVVSAPALVRAGAIFDRRDGEGQRLLRACVEERTFDPDEGPVPYIPDFHVFAESVLSWSFSPGGYAGTEQSPIPSELEVPLPDYGETLSPDFAVRELDPQEGVLPWQLLINVLEPGEDLDHVIRGNSNLEASAHGRMERLLRQTGVPAGLLFNGRTLRLVSAPRGESSGWLDFNVADMIQTAGRPISTAMRQLLDQPRLLALQRSQRLAALLEDSRKFQNEVSERLSEQVLHALYELLRGFQAAHDGSKGQLLREPLAEHPDAVYHALLTVTLRIVFLLYAEERDMLPEDETFLRNYSIAALHERLREDAALFPDTMDQRYGAWPQLLVLFRMIYDGAESGPMKLPVRHGVLFDPDRFPFLEGRLAEQRWQTHNKIDLPLVPDGTIFRVLENLLVLDGERISYRALDVEQIGSVYETMMGFRLETATGRSVSIRAQKKQGAPVAVNLETLLREPAAKRAKWIQDHADRKLNATVKKAVSTAASLEDLHAALMPMIDTVATPDLVPLGAMVLQPSEERRRSGSHYTPRALTEPIVRKTLEPILARLHGADGRPPRAEQILDLRVCDPAMGSGAFLVEVCRRLGDALVEAWHAHGEAPVLPADEDEVVFARRLIAQRCLYGVDKNPVAVDLAKVSLWLVTLAKDHPLTFVDHALRHGDSLVGLTRKQIEAFHWDPDAPRFQAGFETMQAREHVKKFAALRKKISEADEGVSDLELRNMWEEAQVEISRVRLLGDLVLAAFFEGRKPKDREAKRSEYASAMLRGEADQYRGWLELWREASRPFVPFHWEVEFPEVFDREISGFDAIVGNPPFLGGSQLSELFGGPEYQEWLKASNKDAFGNGDLCAYFFRRAYSLIAKRGAFGFLATKTISEGGTRTSGLQAILASGGRIYNAVRSQRWPGQAAVLVVVVHIAGENVQDLEQPTLDGKRVAIINSRLYASAELPDPLTLSTNKAKGFFGTKLGGSGFILNHEQYARLAKDPHNRQCLVPFLGGEEVNRSPSQSHERYVINFGSESLEYAQQFPELLELIQTQVKPMRDRALDHGPGKHGKKYWWQFILRADPLYDGIADLSRCIVTARTTAHLAYSFQPVRQVFSESIIAFAFDKYSEFACLQSSVHNIWARLFSSYMGETLRYSVSDAFQTFPLCEDLSSNPRLEAAGQEYCEFRAALMMSNNEGLTKIYNRFHDPEDRDQEIAKLRELHVIMDRAVLDTYGWSDIPTDCEFLLDYEIDEDEWGNKKKPYRYRWPNEICDEVLGRLFELNVERSSYEARSGAATTNRQGKKSASKAAPNAHQSASLF